MNAFDGPSLSGFKVFMDQLNAKGRVDGKKFVLKIVDTKTEQAGSKDAASSRPTPINSGRRSSRLRQTPAELPEADCDRRRLG